MKGIEVFDNFLTHDHRRHIFETAQRSLFQIGWDDSPELDKKHQPCLHSRYNLNDLRNIEIWNPLLEIAKKSKFKKSLTLNKLKETVLNLTKPGDINYTHTHHKRVTALYYINPTWDIEWGGETLFFDDQVKNISFVSPFTPNRLIIADGAIPHTIKAQNYGGPAYRFTLTMFFLK